MRNYSQNAEAKDSIREMKFTEKGLKSAISGCIVNHRISFHTRNSD